MKFSSASKSIEYNQIHSRSFSIKTKPAHSLSAKMIGLFAPNASILARTTFYTHLLAHAPTGTKTLYSTELKGKNR